jgi:hypothetical protein
MPVIMIFQQNDAPLAIRDLSESMAASLGVPCFLFDKGRKLSAADVQGEAGVLSEGQVWVELPDLQEDEGEPVVSFEIMAREERDEAVQEMIDEIVNQEGALQAVMNQNTQDIIITYEDTLAGYEAGNAFAYIVANETGSGILVPGTEEDEETLWFESAEDFADAAFSEDEDGDDDEGEWEEEDEDDEK